MACGQLGAHRPLHSDPFLQSFFLPPSLVHGVISPQVENFLFLFIKCHEISFGTFLQPLEVSLNGSTNQITWTHVPTRLVPHGALTSRSLNGSK